MSATCERALRRVARPALRRTSRTLNCGYGRGFSVLEVIKAVKRASGVDLKVEIAPRRPGDPARIVADSRQVRATLGWQPRFDDLSTIVAHPLAPEREFTKRGTARMDQRERHTPTAVATAVPLDPDIAQKA
jgi:UDP-glucose 4-epimerase